MYYYYNYALISITLSLLKPLCCRGLSSLPKWRLNSPDYLANINAYYVSFCNGRKRLRSNARTGRFDTEENMGQDNPTWRRPRSLPDVELEMEDVIVSPQAKRQPNAGFSKPHIYPGDHCQTLDNANVSSHNLYPHLLRFGGATGTQSKV